MARTVIWSRSSCRRCPTGATTNGVVTRSGGCAFVSRSCAASGRASRRAFAVGIKLNSADFQRGGFTEDESRGVLAALAGEGLDLIEVSGGSYETPAMMGKAADSTRAREAYFLEYARTVRGSSGDVPLAVTGGFRSRAAMAEAVGTGECDVIGLGRPTVTTTDAAGAILHRSVETVVAHQVRAGMRGVLGRFVDLKSLDGILELSWHTDQLHRIGAGLDTRPRPGPDRHHAGDAPPQRHRLVQPQTRGLGVSRRRPRPAPGGVRCGDPIARTAGRGSPRHRRGLRSNGPDAFAAAFGAADHAR